MKKVMIPLMKKMGEKAAMVPVNVRSWPGMAHQPNMPEFIRAKMKAKIK